MDLIKDSKEIEMLDALIIFKLHYMIVKNGSVKDIMKSKLELLLTPLNVIFGIYIFFCFLIMCLFNCVVVPGVRKSVWNAKIILKLLPVDEMSLEFKQTIVRYVQKP